MTNSRGLLLQQHKQQLTVRDPMDQKLIATARLDPTNFHLEVIPESRNLGIGTEICQWLLENIFFGKPVTLSVETNNIAARQMIEKLKYTLLSNSRNTATVRIEPIEKSLGLNTELSHIQKLLGSLKIPPESIQLQLQYRPCQLIDIGMDMYNRPTQLHPAAFEALQRMQAAAAKEKLSIDIVSGYRSYTYQHQLLQNKLDKGLELADILAVNAAPGFSEHHSGCAVDLSMPGYQPLEEIFDQSPLFDWLTENANNYGFFMTYPSANDLGIIYEPWHWCFHSD